MFLEASGKKCCECCGSIVSARLRIVPLDKTGTELISEAIPVIDDARIYACQLNRVVNADEVLNPIMWILKSKHDSHTYACKNMTQSTWYATANGTRREVPPGKIVRIQEGMYFNIDNAWLRVGRIN